MFGKSLWVVLLFALGIVLSFFITWFLVWLVWSVVLIGIFHLVLPALTLAWVFGIWIILGVLHVIF